MQSRAVPQSTHLFTFFLRSHDATGSMCSICSATSKKLAVQMEKNRKSRQTGSLFDAFSF